MRFQSSPAKGGLMSLKMNQERAKIRRQLAALDLTKEERKRLEKDLLSSIYFSFARNR